MPTKDKRANNSVLRRFYDFRHIAARYGQLKVIKELIDKGAKTNAKNSDGLTPLELANREGKNLTGLLLVREAEVDAKDNYNGTDYIKVEVTSGAKNPFSLINSLFSWAKDSVGELFSSRAALSRKTETSTVQSLPNIPQHNETAQGISPIDFLSVESVALIGCIAEALDNTSSKRYQALKSQGVNFVPSIQTAVNFACMEFDSFVEDKIRNLDSKGKNRIRAEVKNAYPEIVKSFRRGAEFSGNIGLDNVLEKCKECFCTNILLNNFGPSEDQLQRTTGKTDDKPESYLSSVTVSNQLRRLYQTLRLFFS